MGVSFRPIAGRSLSHCGICGYASYYRALGGLTLRASELRESVSYDAVLLFGLFYIARGPVTLALDGLGPQTSDDSNQPQFTTRCYSGVRKELDATAGGTPYRRRLRPY